MKTKTLLLFFFALATYFFLPAQSNQIGAHGQQHDEFWKGEIKSEKGYDAINQLQMRHDNPISRKCILNKQVYGWHPAWSGTAYKQYDFAIINRIGYFSYEVNPKTGSYTTINQWRETDLVDNAHQSGAQVELTASLFGGKSVAEFLNNPKATKTFRDSLIQLLKFKDADGVCIDFEGMGKASRAPFVTFIHELSQDLLAWKKDASLTLALYAIDWDGAFDIPSLVPKVDRFIVMGYDYHSGGSPNSGPVAPLEPSAQWGEQSVKTSLETYLKAGVPKEKLLLGVPYYGYQWKTSSRQPKSPTQRKGKSVLLREFIAAGNADQLEWDSASTTGWLPQQENGQIQQLWIDQHTSLDAKYELVNQLGIAGIGIWALGYDHGSTKYVDLIKKRFADCDAANSASLTADYKPAMPPLEGQTSAERNTWNWVWMLGGGLISVGIIWLVIRYM